VGFKLIFPSGPLFPATIFGADVIKVLILGTVAAIPALVVGLLFSYRFGRDNDAKESEGVLSFEELEKSYGKLPSLVASFSVLLVPIILIVARSVFDNLLDLSNSIRVVFDLIGHPVLALPIGIGIALLLAKDKPREEVNHWITGGIQRAAPILVIVGAAGIFGAVLQMTGIGSFLGNSTIAFGVPGVLVAFLVAALIKTMLGSSTVALVTAPAIILPILPSLGISPALAAIAVSAGTLICINVNDSFFWVVTGFGEMDVSTGYRTITLMSVLLGLTALVVIVLVAPLIGA
jgi:GntP family gluconate:H+ symporter